MYIASMEKNWCIGFICVLVLLWSAATWNTAQYEKSLYGYWMAEGDKFCQDAKIDSMLLFIGDATCGWYRKSRSCYIVIMNGFYNGGFTIDYCSGWSGIGIGKYNINATVKFDEKQIWNEKIKIQLDILRGVLTIKNHEDEVYAKLNKQHEITNTIWDIENSSEGFDPSATEDSEPIK